MAVVKISGLAMIEIDFSYSEKYWPEISSFVNQKYGDKEIKEASVVQEVLKDCFKQFEQYFQSILAQKKIASFFILVHNFHENSILLWEKQLKGENLAINKSHFAAIRRVLKIILEQACGYKLKGTPNFNKELFLRRYEYQAHLEELLYLGHKAIELSEYVARSQLFPKSVGIHVIRGELNILFYNPYNALYKFIDDDLPKHNEKVEIFLTLEELKRTWKESLNIDIGILGGNLLHQENEAINRFAVVLINDFIEKISEQFKYPKNLVIDFYAGLTLHKDNKLDFEDCILRNQDLNRHTFRPILQLDIDDNQYWLVGINKWNESLTILSYNAFPFGFCPPEWMKHEAIKKYIHKLEDTHDEILEVAAEKLLDRERIDYDRKVQSLKTRTGNNINLAKKGIGDFDIIFLDKFNKVINVCESKHNRARFDLFGWRRDYHNFKETYEKQLTKKIQWVESFKQEVLEHFEIKYKFTLADKQEYIVRGIFLINAPTIYMYDCVFPTLTLHNFEEFLTGRYFPAQFSFTDENEIEHKIDLPYFQNFNNLMEKLYGN